jgi:hypothetical protein
MGVMCAAGLAATVHGQSFVNGDFETGSMSPWVVTNTANGVGAPGSVTMVDIDGPGPLGMSQAATFMAGQAVFTAGVQEGVEMVQGASLTAGVTYNIDFDWAAVISGGSANAEGGVFTLIIDGVPIVQQAAGFTQAPGRFGHLSSPFTPTTTRDYRIGIRITRPYILPGNLSQYVDNVRLGGPGPAPCYADCNGDHALNVNDFVCFQSAFAAAMPTADCNHDNSLNVNDFVCFQAAFAAGCSSL